MCRANGWEDVQLSPPTVNLLVSAAALPFDAVLVSKLEMDCARLFRVFYRSMQLISCLDPSQLSPPLQYDRPSSALETAVEMTEVLCVGGYEYTGKNLAITTPS